MGGPHQPGDVGERRRHLSSRFLIPFALFFAASSGGVVVLVAGVPAPGVGTIGEDGPADQAALNNAEDVATAPNGDIYIADYNSQRLLRIRDGILTVAYRGDFSAPENDFSGVTVAPDGTVYFTTGQAVLSLSPDGTIAEVAPLGGQGQVMGQKLAVGPDGSVYVAGGRVPRIDRVDEDGTITLVAGADELATVAGEGDGGPATEARFSSISEMAIDSAGVIYVADDGFGDVRAISPDGTISTVFGAGQIPTQEAVDGTAAADVDNGSGEIGVAVDDSDRLYIVTRLGGRVFVVESGDLTTILGGGPNPGTGSAPLDTQLQAPFRVAVEDDGDLLVLVEDGRFLYQSGGASLFALIDSVPSPAGINLDPVVVAASIAITAGMLFLIPFPAEIFNNTLVEHYDQVRRWFRRTREGSAGWDRWWMVALALVAMALLFGFLDPGFGLNSASLPVFLGLLAGVVITTVGFTLPTILMRRGRTGEWGRLRVLPIGILVGVGCVLLSRAIGFLPGYLYGLALGLMFKVEVGEDIESSEVAVTSVVMLAIAIGSWFGLGAVRAGSGSPLLEGALAMTTVAAFEALVFGLLPIHGMPGRVLFQQKRWLWLAVWGVAVLAFFHVLVNPQSGYLVDTALVPVAATYGLLALFTLVSLGLWAWFRRQDRVSQASHS